MSSRKPAVQRVTAFPISSPVQRSDLSLGAFTANTTVVTLPRFIADRRCVIREVWLAASAIPADADGACTVNMYNYDVSEAADDTLITAADLETIVLVANKAYQLTLDAETTENELTLEAGDCVRFTLVNDSAAINTNANITVRIIWQAIKSV